MRETARKHRYPQARKSRTPRTHCKHGHEWTEANTRWKKKPNGARTRECITCQRERNRQQNARFTGLGGAPGTGLGGPWRTGRGREMQRAAEQRAKQAAWWAAVLARPDADGYKRQMLAAVAEMQAYDRGAGERQKRGILGQPARKRNAAKAAEVAA